MPTGSVESPLPAALDVVVIGGGQSALATGYYLRRSGLTYRLVDDQAAPGGTWRRAWPSMRLFSPGQWSSLPGWLMPRGVSTYPTRDETIAYLTAYEQRYELPVVRPVRVTDVTREGELLRVRTTVGDVRARAVVSATGSWANPLIPDLPNRDVYRGQVLHSAHYPGPDSFTGKRIVVVGAGNSAAQIAAELSRSADVTWATLVPPAFLPDDIDGRYLFEQATVRYRAIQRGETPPPARSLGDIVMVESVRDARERGALVATPMFAALAPDGVVWPGGRTTPADAVILATGFRAALGHLTSLGVVDERGRVDVQDGRARKEPRLWLVGYGEWTGFASATLIGVGRSARAVVQQIEQAMGGADVG